MARKFYLENEKGEQFELNDREYCVLTDPQGLGFGNEMDFILIGDTFRASKKVVKQQKFDGVINFMKPDHYNKYRVFTDYVLASKTLELIYEPKENEQYLRGVEIGGIKKGEIDNKDSILKCPIELYFETLYYKKSQSRYEIQANANGVSYPYQLPAQYNDSSRSEVGFDNDGQTNAAIVFEYHGIAQNPTIDICNSANEEVFSLRLTDFLAAGEKIRYSSIDDNLYITKVDASGNETNIIDSFTDLTQQLFFKVPRGFHTIRFRKDDVNNSFAVLYTFRYYRAV